MNCPICGATIKEGIDLLLLRYHPPRDWWVVNHYVSSDAHPGHLSHVSVDGKEWVSWCASADTDRQIEVNVKLNA